MIGQPVAQGILEVRSGIGTIVAERMDTSAAERTKRLKKELEQLAVEVKKLELNLEQLITAFTEHWRRLEGDENGRDTPDSPAMEMLRENFGIGHGESDTNERESLRPAGSRRRR